MAATDQLLTQRHERREADTRQPGQTRRANRLGYLLLAVISYVPLLFTSPGQVGADTKSYLYLDPGRLIQGVASSWDPTVGMGTVTHQMIGYLLPMGPFYFVFHHLGLPVWVAQRLWLGSLLFAAGSGAAFLARVVGLEGPGRLVAALSYMLSPYLLEYAARISAILMPWAGLPWMVALIALALRRGGWRYPALFALLVLLIGGVNATSLLYAGLAPALWIPYAVWVSREVTGPRVLTSLVRTAGLTVLVSLWWIAGLWAQGAFGLDVLRYTETVKTVARTSLASEVLRGLGYWFFYGQDKLGPWIQPAVDYTQRLWLIAISFLLPTLAFLAAVITRWRHRAYFILLILVGTVLSVADYPYNNPTPLGGVLKSVANGSTVGLAMRSTPRAAPLAVLGTSMLLGAGISALALRLTASTGQTLWRFPLGDLLGSLAAAVVIALVLANIYPLWAGTIIGGNLRRPEAIPSYWTSAASYLDSRGRDPARGYDTRVLGIPGSDFASYRWGNTVDPIEPGIMTRPYVAREIFPYGTAGTVNLLNALDSRLQQGIFVPSSLAPVARLMSAGDVLYRADLQYERYNTPRPQLMESWLNPVPRGLSAPKGFGEPGPSIPVKFPMKDEIALTLPPANLPPVSVYGVPGARPIVRADPASKPLLVDGDALGIVYAADTGILDTNAAVIYTPSLAGNASAIRRDLAGGADLLLTDTNRKQAVRWGTIRENTGYTETATETPAVADPSDQRLPLFPDAGTNAYTVVQLSGVGSVIASGYANPITYTPEDRASNAFDGDIRTAWKVGDFDNPVGQWLRINLTAPVTTNNLTLVQPIYGSRNRHITMATLSFDGKNPITVQLGDASQQPSGQVVTFSPRSFSSLQITIDATDTGPRASYAGLSAVGFAEVKIGGVASHVDGVLSLPTDMLQAAGQGSLRDRLVILMTRERASAFPLRQDPELNMARTFWLPTSRDFAISGTARLSALGSDDQIDQALGRPGTDGSGVVATSSTRLIGDAAATASATIEGHSGAYWSPSFGPQQGSWLDYRLPSPVTLDHLVLQVLADGRHSVPTQIRVDGAGQSRVADLPLVASRSTPGATVAIPVHFTPITGTDIRITFTKVAVRNTKDYYSEQPIAMPIGIAKVGIPGVQAAPLPLQLPGTCRADLLSVDGRPFSVRVVESTSDAQALAALSVQPCGADANGITLSAGNHVVRTTVGWDAGFNIDQLALASSPGGAPLYPQPSSEIPASNPGPAPSVRVLDQNRTEVKLSVRNPGRPFWLVLGQSQDRGWSATLPNGTSLGQSRLIDGYANGWYLNPAGMPASIEVTLRFTPQRTVWLALILSGMGAALCLGIVLWPMRRWWRGRRALRVSSKAGSDLHGSAPPADRSLAGTQGRASTTRDYQLVIGQDGAAAGRVTGIEPQLRSPLASGGQRRCVPVSLAVAVATGCVFAALIKPLAGLVIGLVVLSALLSSRRRWPLTIGSVALLAITGLYMVGQQLRWQYPSEFEWPTFFPIANTLAWFAVALLACDAVVELVRRGRPPPTTQRREV